MLWEFISIGYICVRCFKEKFEKEIPASYWRNEELMRKDKLDPSISPEQVMKNLKKGKYFLPDTPVQHIEKESCKRDVHIPKGDYVQISYSSVDSDYFEFRFRRCCKSIDKYKTVSIGISKGYCKKYNKITDEVYKNIITKLQEYYNNRLTEIDHGWCKEYVLKEC